MSRDIDSEPAQLLNQSPHFGAARRNLLADLGPADDDRSVLHEQTYDAAKPHVRGLMFVRRPSPRPNCAGLSDAEIMRESPPNDKLAVQGLAMRD